MFDVACSLDRPVSHIEISSVWLRGALGPTITVWTTDESFRDKNDKPQLWQKRCEAENVIASPETLVEFTISPSLRLVPGETAGFYVHSSSS